MDHGAVWGWYGLSCVHHGYHSNAEVDPESVDHSKAKEHQDGQVEADRAALTRDCSHRDVRTENIYIWSGYFIKRTLLSENAVNYIKKICSFYLR